MKLTLKDIACYLPYGLKMKDVLNDEIFTLDVENLSGVISDLELNTIKPLFRPLSSLYKPLKDGSVPIVEIARLVGLSFVRYELGGSCVDLYLTDRKGKKARFWYDGFKTATFCLTIYGFGKVNQLAGFDYLYSNHFWLGDQSYFEKGLIMNLEEVEE